MGAATVSGDGEYVFTFDDLRGGFVSPQLAERSREPSEWTGKNISVYPDGTWGPRKGVYRTPLSGVPAGNLWAFGISASLTNNVWMLIGNTFYRGTTTGSSVSSFGTVAVTPTQTCPWVQFGFAVLLTVPGDKTYIVNSITGTVTAIAGSPGGRAIAYRNGRCYVAHGNRLRWSHLNDVTDWSIDNSATSGGELYVGSDLLDITAILEVRDVLYLFKPIDGVYAVTGLAPDEFQLRKVATASTAEHWSHAAQWRGAPLVHMSRGAAAAPSVLNGVKFEALMKLAGVLQTNNLLTVQDDIGFGYTEYDGTVVLLDGPEKAALVWLSSVQCWTFAQFAQLPALRGSTVLMQSHDGICYLASTGGGSAPAIYEWYPDFGPPSTLYAPGIAGAAREMPGDDSTTPMDVEVTFAEMVHPKGEVIQPKMLYVELMSIATGAAVANGFDVEVTCTSRTGQSSNTLSSTTGSWTEATAPPAGKKGAFRQVRIPLGAQAAGSAWRLKLSNVRGVRVLRTMVVCSTAPRQGR
jgi:hypothetical protein